MQPRKLSRREFTRAIKNGLGSAVLHIKEYGDKEIQDILLQACTKNYIFDYQIDCDRDWWLYEMINLTGNATTYADHIRNTLMNLPEDSNEKDLEQLINLASHFFDQGYQEFKPLMLTLATRADKKASAFALAKTLTNLFSYHGLALGAQTLQQAMNNSFQETWYNHALFKYACRNLEDEEGTEVKHFLAKKSETDTLIAQFWQGVQSFIAKKEKEQEQRKPRRPDITLAEALKIVTDNKADNKIDFRMRRFGRTASDNDKQILMNLLEQETSEEKLAIILQAFWDVPMPYLPERVKALVFSPIKSQRLGARNALKNLNHPQIRELALQALQSEKQTNIVTGFNLLEKNYQLVDIPLIKSALPYLKNRDKTHWASLSLLDIAEDNDHTGLDDILIWIYNRNPCGMCRHGALELLIERGKTPEQILFEAQWDVDDLVKTLARQATKSEIQMN